MQPGRIKAVAWRVDLAGSCGTVARNEEEVADTLGSKKAPSKISTQTRPSSGAKSSPVPSVATKSTCPFLYLHLHILFFSLQPFRCFACSDRAREALCNLYSALPRSTLILCRSVFFQDQARRITTNMSLFYCCTNCNNVYRDPARKGRSFV